MESNIYIQSTERAASRAFGDAALQQILWNVFVDDINRVIKENNL